MRTATDIEADLAAFYAARTALANGERVTEVWREGRRMTYAGMKITDLNALIIQTEAELARAQQIEAGKARRSAIGTYF
jgi:hypothetical protein